MATPTPGKLAAAHAVATPPVSTPFSTSGTLNHPAFSPHGPRSVQPSPQQIKKSPANSNTLYGYPGGGSHPTSSSFGAGYDSPSAAMALGGVGDLAMDGLGTPGANALNSLGALGVGGRAGDEEERRRRLGAVMDLLKVNKGRLSEAGMERLARRVGLESIWESHMGSGGSSRTLIMAGSATALDIDFANNVVQKVTLSFPESSEIVTRHTEKAGSILLQDLKLNPGESPLTKMLDRFAVNLEQLAQLDRMSVIPALNCHEAIAGIYESLRRLHMWEIERLKESDEGAGKAERELERMALCTKSGRPAMHTRNRLGLSLDYWQNKRRLASKGEDKVEKTWSVLVDCAPLPTIGLYPSIRVSENWISSDIQKADPPADEMFMANDGPILDWIEPENTMLPSTDAPKPDAMEGVEAATQKFPDVMFVAKFDPPIVVPYTLAVQIYNSTNAPIDMYQMSTFDGLMFPHNPEEKIEHAEARTMKTEVEVPVFDKEGKKAVRIHKNSLFMEKIDYGRTLTELPFSHPSQLVGMFPALRQYAFLSTVLSKSFGSHTKRKPIEEKEESKKSKRDDFAAFMAHTSKPEDDSLIVDVSFSTQPFPRLQVVFPFRNRTANVTFDIKLDGAVDVVSQNVLVDEKRLTVSDLGRMLEVTEDLGLWCEFVRRRLGG